MDKKPNHLIHETSPYLLQHAYNPVHWYPWGQEALQLAKKQDKPILISIGYSACHWCHVMERESFEDENTAELMNQNFINIKIDREERPDLDQVYMDAVQAIAGNGGWPLNVFLTPDAKPFYGGTYFPPANAFNRSSWTDVLNSVNHIFINQREEVEAKAEELTLFISRGIPFTNENSLNELSKKNGEIISEEQIEDIFKNIIKQADTTWGGFGKAPKFPQTFTINYLLTYFYYSQNKAAKDQASLSLDKMIAGGIYDQIDGGLSRYSTDIEWLAPHFEKMLYDNALLITSLSNAYKITKNESYKDVVHETITFLKRELRSPEGGYYAALDADSEGEEGKFYVWSHEEIFDVLGNDTPLFCKYYDVSQNGNWEGKNILRRIIPEKQIAKEFNLSILDLKQQIQTLKQQLLLHRNSRVRPATDDKIILGWNALLINSLAIASKAFENKDYLMEAETCFSFLLKKFTCNNDQSILNHNYKNGLAANAAFLDDYAYLISAAIRLFECTSNSRYITIAKLYTEYVIANFSSDDLFYYTHKEQKDIIVRKKEIYDGALPSANAVMGENLMYLSVIFDIPSWKEIVHRNLNNLMKIMTTYPSSFGVWNQLLINMSKGVREIAITGKDFGNYRDQILKEFIPGIIQASNDPTEEIFPLLNGRMQQQSQTQIFICKDYVCALPENDIEKVINSLLKC